jgi:hypothetical protein
MRPFASILCLAILVPFTGCENGGKRFMIGPSSASPTPAPAGVPSAEALVAYLNGNAANMQSLRCVEIKGDFQGYWFSAKMMAMKPRNFFMAASAFGSSIVDLGSNDNEFWFWSSKAPEPNQFFCSYKDFESGRAQSFPFPFQPDWIMETLGMGPYGPPDKYSVERNGKTVRLVEKTRTPQGHAVRKVIVMSLQQETPPNPQVQAYLILNDATGKEICSAQIQATELLRVKDLPYGVLVPRRLEFRVPDQKVSLKLAFSGMTANELNPTTDLAIFQRHRMEGVPEIDLGRSPVGGTGR